MNNHLVLLCGKSAVGKTTSLRNILNPEGVAYANCEAGKSTPFACKFNQQTVTDPLQVPQTIDALIGNPKYHTIIVDSLSFLMQMYESVYVLNAINSQKEWGAYSNFFISMMQQSVARSDKTIIFTSHVGDTYNESEMVTETKAVVKGGLNKIGLESYFSVVIAAKRMKVKDLIPFTKNNPLLVITPKEEKLGVKYVYQTMLTKETINERIRGPLGMWRDDEDCDETYIDADMQLVINRLNEYYK